MNFPVVPLVDFHNPLFLENSSIEFRGVTESLTHEAWRDSALGIQRKQIPCHIMFLPNSPQGIRCGEIFQQLDQMLDISIIPDNKNLALLLRCIQYKRQIRALWFANEVCDCPIPNLPDRHLYKLTYREGFDQLKAEVPNDLALYHLLHAGEAEIRQWCQQHHIPYPFQTPFELFQEIWKEEFTKSIESYFNPCPFPTTKRTREDDGRLWTSFLSDRLWDEEEQNAKYQKSNQDLKAELIAGLKQSGWLGYAVLAIWEKKQAPHLKEFWRRYFEAYKRLTLLPDDTIICRQGQPTIAGNTSHRIPIEGETTNDGYFIWYFST